MQFLTSERGLSLGVPGVLKLVERARASIAIAALYTLMILPISITFWNQPRPINRILSVASRRVQAGYFFEATDKIVDAQKTRSHRC
ncbi:MULTISPECIES: hypothetical protein [unclassified Microcoleus]|uniref:hypothetical protein n=1 Tax=unclassified Microcoleus TaxID=2642155 RepID=UPI0025FC508D|nr:MULTISPECIES: hypothetical protein [unclassified Microcoleus]